MIKDVNDYIPAIKKQYPMLSDQAIKQILVFGFHMYHWVTMRGCDILVKDDAEHKITAMTGFMYTCPLRHYKHGLKKWKLKENLLAKIRNKPWDGYYYFGLTEERASLFNEALKNNRIKTMQLDNIMFYRNGKVLLHDKSIDHIYKLQYPAEVGEVFYKFKYKYLKKYIQYVGQNNKTIWKTRPIPLQED